MSRSVSSPASRVELATLQSVDPDGPLVNLASWHEIRATIDGLKLKNGATDPLLRPVLRSAQQAGMPEAWQSIILYICWSGLTMLFRWHIRTKSDPYLLWSELTWSFFRAARRIDLDRRVSKLGRKLVNDTSHDVRAYLNRSDKIFLPQCSKATPRNQTPCFVPFEACVDADDVGLGDPIAGYPSDRIEEAEFIVRDEREWAMSCLRKLYRAGILSRPDFLVLLGCGLYGRSLDEMASRLGVSYDAAKKQRQRAVARLNKHAPDLSPNLPESPLYIERQSGRREVGRG